MPLPYKQRRKINLSRSNFLRPGKYTLIFCLSILLSHSSFGQTNTTDILQSAWQDPRLQAYQQELDFFGNQRSLQVPRLEEMEFRTETHEFNPTLQEYALRLQFNTRRQIRVQTRVNQQEYSLRQLKRESYLEELLFNRYQVLIEMHFQQKRRALLQTEAPLLQDMERVIQVRILEEGERHYDDWLDLEEDRMLHQQEYQLLIRQVQAAQQQCSRWLGQEIDSLQTVNWPGVDQLERNWQNWQTDTLVLPFAVQEQQINSSLIALELEAEQAEERNRLNFLQVRYRGEDRERILREQLTIGVGITLPFRSANSVKAQYLELEQLEEQHQEIERHRKWLEDLRAAEANMAIALDHYRQLESALREYQDRFGARALNQSGVSRPEVYLQAARGKLQRSERLLAQEQRLYESYLDVLLLSGRLISRPYRNWLSSLEEQLTQ